MLNICTERDFIDYLRDNLQDIVDESSIKSCVIEDIILEQDCYLKMVRVTFKIKVSQSESHNLRAAIKLFLKKVHEELIPSKDFCWASEIICKVRVTEPISGVYVELERAGVLSKQYKEENSMKQLPEIKKIIHSGDYTHIMWNDGTKTSVKKAEDMPYDSYSAFAQAVVKKLFGSTEKAKFEHELRQHSEKEQKKILAEKEFRRAKQQKAEKKKLDRKLKKQEKELAEKKRQVEATRALRAVYDVRSGEPM